MKCHVSWDFTLQYLVLVKCRVGGMYHSKFEPHIRKHIENIFSKFLKSFAIAQFAWKWPLQKFDFTPDFWLLFYLVKFAKKSARKNCITFERLIGLRWFLFWNHLIFQEKFDSALENGVNWTETCRGIFLWSYIIFSRGYLTFKYCNSKFLWQNTYSLKILAILKKSVSTRKRLSIYGQKYAMLENQS